MTSSLKGHKGTGLTGVTEDVHLLSNWTMELVYSDTQTYDI